MVLASGMTVWEERLRLASEAARAEGRRLASETDGPLVEPLRLAGWDSWRGATGDHFRGLILELSRRHLDPLEEQILRCADALEQLQQDVIQKNYTRMRCHREPVGQGVMWAWPATRWGAAAER